VTVVNKIFLADTFQVRQNLFGDMQLAWHYGYFESLILGNVYLSKPLWSQKSAEEAYKSLNDRKNIKAILDFLDENGAFYDIGVSFVDGRPFMAIVGLCLNQHSSVLLRMM